MEPRGRAEERVDRRPMSALARAAAQAHDAVVENEMPVRRSDVDAASLERLAVRRVRRPEWTD